MAKVKLVNGVVTGAPTEGKDTVTVGIEFVRQGYTLDLLGGDDTVDLGPASNLNSFYRITTGAGNDTVTGGSGEFDDSAGNDVYRIIGYALFRAGSGNDTYDGGESAPFNERDFDTVSFHEAPDDLTKVNTQGLTIDLEKKTAQNLGRFGMDKLLNIESIIAGIGHDKLFGNSDSNDLNGDGVNDGFSSVYGNDKLYGRGGDDSLNGEGGNDKLYGGSGRDQMYGGNGTDFFQGGSGGDQIDLREGVTVKRDTVSYTSIADSKLYSGLPAAAKIWDTIFGFDKGGGKNDDLISFEAIDTSKSTAGDQDFVFIGSAKFTKSAAWQIRLKKLEGTFGTESTIIQIDTDSDTAAEMEIVVTGITGLKAHDFDF